MRQRLRGIYHFLPVQLLLLHFRRYQVLLLFWVVLIATISGNFADNFGAATVFLSPEYLGNVNFASMMLLGCAMGVFLMSWHITTFIIHSKRIPFLGATRQAFLKFCINNSLLPIAFLIFYSVVSIRYQWSDEHLEMGKVVRLQFGFYAGFLSILIVSFAYFFSVDRNLVKSVITRITNPAIIKGIIPYDTLDMELDIVPAQTYLSETLRLEHIKELENYHPRFLNTVLRRHHRNAIVATLFAFIMLVLLGVFMEMPLLRIPAGAGFLLLFAVTMGIAGAVKYFLRSWELIGWVIFICFMSWMVDVHLFDFRSPAFGVDYHTPAAQLPKFQYDYLHKIFSTQRYEDDKKLGITRLNNWKNKRAVTGDTIPPLVVITISGGGTRAAYFTFRTLQYLDSLTQGKLFNNTVLISGASGGMIGATYWRCVHEAYQEGKIKNPYDPQYQENIGKDLLNAIIFSLASVDLVFPFDNVMVNGYSYGKDRAYAMEREMIANTDGMLNKNLGDYRQKEFNAEVPALIVNGTIINDGRTLMMSAQPVGYLTQPEYTLNKTNPPIDAIDFATYFEKQNPYNLRIASALRMNATFPYILPVVKLPSVPAMNVMDAGLRDNFGIELASRYLYVFRDWIKDNTHDAIFIEIRDTKENELFPPADQNTLAKMIMDPAMIIQNKWESLQSYNHCYIKDYAPSYLSGRLHFLSFQYVPADAQEYAELNFHLTQKEKTDIYQSIYNPINRSAKDTLMRLIK
jgi:hypothetical protein